MENADDLVSRYLDGALTVDEFVELLTGHSPIVGYLMPHKKGFLVLCMECMTQNATTTTEDALEKFVPVFRENILPLQAEMP